MEFDYTSWPMIALYCFIGTILFGVIGFHIVGIAFFIGMLGSLFVWYRNKREEE